MKRNLLFILLFVAACRPNEEIKRNSPRQLFPGLFQDVQTSHVFPDSKTFVDCIAKESPEDIVNAYNAEKGKAGFVLKDFVLKHFTVPQPAAIYMSDSTQDVSRISPHYGMC
jgi:alpha,alpha-trehalase